MSATYSECGVAGEYDGGYTSASSNGPKGISSSGITGYCQWRATSLANSIGYGACIGSWEYCRWEESYDQENESCFHCKKGRGKYFNNRERADTTSCLNCEWNRNENVIQSRFFLHAIPSSHPFCTIKKRFDRILHCVLAENWVIKYAAADRKERLASLPLYFIVVRSTWTCFWFARIDPFRPLLKRDIIQMVRSSSAERS